MSDTPAKPVLLTGASGALGRVLVRHLGGLGCKLVLTDIAPPPADLLADARVEARTGPLLAQTEALREDLAKLHAATV